MEHVINWFVDTLARTETLDLYFIITELIDFPETDAERYDGAVGDSMAEDTARNARKNNRVPIGKQVF